jgi:hypothetical protein
MGKKNHPNLREEYSQRVALAVVGDKRQVGASNNDGRNIDYREHLPRNMGI